MKKVNVIVMQLFWCLTLFGAEATVKVTIDQPGDYTIYVSHVENYFTDEEIGYQININDNIAEFSLNLYYPKLVTMRYGTTSFRLFVSPNDRQQVNFSGYDIAGTLRFFGSNAAANQFLKNLDQQFPENNPNRTVYQEYLPALMDETIVRQAEGSDVVFNAEAVYMDLVASRKRQKIALLSNSNLNNTARTFMSDMVKFDEKSEKLFYYLVNKYNFLASQVAASREKYQLLAAPEVNYTPGLQHPAYIKYISIYIQYLNLTKKQHPSGVEFTFYELIEEQLKGEVQAFMKTKLMYNTFRFGQVDLAQTKYSDFKKDGKYPKYTTLLNDLFGDKIEFAAEGEPPSFTLVDMDGKQVSLSDFKGKVVYLSFWATWCKPCLSGFEKSLFVRKRLEEAGVVLLNISIDKKDEVWRRTMARIEMPGINLFAPDEGIIRSYGLTSLPVYHIIDKQGRYAYLPQEGMRDVVEEFKKLVDE